MESNIVLDGIMGVCVGDALGVPVEFKSRDYLKKNPISDMIGYGTYRQPPGTWSDDSSLTLCLAESLTFGYDLSHIGQTFVKWYHKGYWTPHGIVFDAGGTTRNAIRRLYQEDIKPQDAGDKDEWSNGNGSLMRILPLAFYVKPMPFEERVQIIADVSSLTHGHIRSIISCVFYIEFILSLLEKKNLDTAYIQACQAIKSYFGDSDELKYFYHLLAKDISQFDEYQIESSGYVVHTLEASIWCLITTTSYAECVLKAVNLGQDTDTTGAVAGGLAGIYYGFKNIPKKWVDAIARKDEIIQLSIKLKNVLKI